MRRLLATVAAIVAVVVAIFIYAKKRAALELRAKQLRADANKAKAARDESDFLAEHDAEVKIAEIKKEASKKEEELVKVEAEIKALDSTKGIADAWNRRRSR